MIRGAVQLSATNFKLLGSAGGERHMHDLFRIQSHLFGKIGFHRGPLHADGALCGGQMGQQLVNWGRGRSFSVMRRISSLASSTMVRSAAKLVSST